MSGCWMVVFSPDEHGPALALLNLLQEEMLLDDLLRKNEEFEIKPFEGGKQRLEIKLMGDGDLEALFELIEFFLRSKKRVSKHRVGLAVMRERFGLSKS